MILGGCGRFAGGEVSKVYSDLPEHTSVSQIHIDITHINSQFLFLQVRLRANFHFIDKWGGETAFAKLQDNYVWTDSFDQVSSKSGIDLCCSPAPESKYSVPIDVMLPHTASSVKVTFGSTLSGSPMEQSWGVSDVQILVRKA